MIERVLQEMAAANGGRLTPDEVVAVAANPASPLHQYFEWDDSKAAANYRLHQARALIRSVRIVVKTETKQVNVVAYVRDPEQHGRNQGYVETLSLRSDADLAREVVAEEFKRVAASLRRARDVAAVIGMLPAIDNLMGELELATKALPPGEDHPS